MHRHPATSPSLAGRNSLAGQQPARAAYLNGGSSQKVNLTWLGKHSSPVMLISSPIATQPPPSMRTGTDE